MIAKCYNGPCGWEHPGSDSKKPWLFFAKAMGTSFRPCARSRVKRARRSSATLTRLSRMVDLTLPLLLTPVEMACRHHRLSNEESGSILDRRSAPLPTK